MKEKNLCLKNTNSHPITLLKTSETVFVKNEFFITPFLLTHTLNDLFDLQDDLGPLDTPPPSYQRPTILKKERGGGGGTPGDISLTNPSTLGVTTPPQKKMRGGTPGEVFCIEFLKHTIFRAIKKKPRSKKSGLSYVPDSCYVQFSDFRSISRYS